MRCVVDNDEPHRLQINVEDSIKESIMSSYKKGPIELFDTAEGKVSAMMREKLTDFQM